MAAAQLADAEIPSLASDAPAIDGSVIKRLSRLQPLRSSAHIALEWSLIVLAAIVCTRHFHPVLYVIAIAFIGGRQHALIVLMHEAAHWRLFRNRTLNDWIGEALLAWPFVFVSMQDYRRNHLPHHRHLNTDHDPDWMRKQTPAWRFPKSRSELARMLLLDISGLGFAGFMVIALRLTFVPARGVDQPRAFRIARLVFMLSAVVAISLLHAWQSVLLFWFVPYVTWMQLCFHVRSIAEHFAIQASDGIYGQTRTVLPTWFDRVFVLPKHANYHLEHHLFPSVPFYRLPELHQILMQQPAYRDGAHLTRGYLGVLRECIQRPAGVERA